MNTAPFSSFSRLSPDSAGFPRKINPARSMFLSVLSFAAFLILGAATSSAQTANFSFVNQGGSPITFTGTGDTISFGHDASDQGFSISNPSNPSSLIGLAGAIDGTFTIDSTHITSGSFGGTTYDEAPVMGTGTLKVYDANNVALTASVNWGNVLRVANTGALNPDGVLNLSNFNYTGSYAPLQALATSTSGSTTVTFQFFTKVTLFDLIQDGTTHSASYSGIATTDSLVAIPEPSSYAALLGVFCFAGVVVRRRQKLAA